MKVNKSTKARSSKRKGKRLENIVAEKFEKSLNLEKGTIHRAQSSGTFKYDIGDIRININPPLPIIIECKNTEQWKYKHFFEDIENIYPFKDWIEQINTTKLKAQKYYGTDDIIWFLIFTKNYEPIYLLTEQLLVDKLLSNSKFKLEKIPDTYVKNDIYYIFELDEFLKNLKYDKS